MQEIEKSLEKENVPVGLVTMLLTGYANTIKKLWVLVIVQAVVLALTIGGFLVYLSQYEVNVSTYGDIDSSHLNMSDGQQADTLNNYYNK